MSIEHNIQAAKTKQQMIFWLVKILNRPPFPVSPRESIVNGVEAKEPAFYDGRFYKPLKWKQYQHWEEIEEETKERLIEKWHSDRRIEGVSTLGGWNGKHWLGWIDIDSKSKCLDSEADLTAACEREFANHLERYPVLKGCPRFRTPSGGFRLLIAFNREPENFKANSGFAFSPDGPRMGELLTKNGGHTLLPPTVGTNGNSYHWEFFAEYPPIAEQPEDVGLFPVHNKTVAKQSTSPRLNQPELAQDDKRRAFLYAFILNDCLPRLNWEQIYDDSVCNFHRTGEEVKGCCPLPDRTHPNESGTAFSVNTKDNTWYCFGCSTGGSAVQFIDRVLGGDGNNPSLQQLERVAEEFGVRARISSPAMWWKQSKQNYKNGQQSGACDIDLVNRFRQHQQQKSSIAGLEQQIREFLDTAPSETAFACQILEWSEEFGRHPNAIRPLVNAIRKELELEHSRSERVKEVERLLKFQNYQLRLIDYIPSLSPLGRVAEWMGTTEVAMLTTLLAVAASLLKVGTQLELIEATGFYALPILYTGIVAESGSGKSPGQKTILKPLFRLQSEAEQDYQDALEEWEAKCKAAKESGVIPPPKPTPREYFTTDATREAVVQIQASQPNYGFLGWFDELSGLIHGQNQYRNGRGTDKEALLSGRDGSAQKVNRSGGKRLFVEQSAYSITGSTQPDTLRSLMGDFSDPSGQWARFLWCVMPTRSSPFPNDAISYDVSEMLYGIYKQLQAFIPKTYRLSEDALYLYKDWYNQLDHLRLVEPRQGIRAVYQKMKGDVGVLTLLLHCINAAAQGQHPADLVSAGTIKAAIQLSKFYLGQVKLIYSEGDAANGELSDIHTKLIALSQRVGWLSAKTAKNYIWAFRKCSMDEIRSHFRELTAMGKGNTRGDGNKLEWSY